LRAGRDSDRRRRRGRLGRRRRFRRWRIGRGRIGYGGAACPRHGGRWRCLSSAR
jgi:hypothetical protein